MVFFGLFLYLFASIPEDPNNIHFALKSIGTVMVGIGSIAIWSIALSPTFVIKNIVDSKSLNTIKRTGKKDFIIREIEDINF